MDDKIFDEFLTGIKTHVTSCLINLQDSLVKDNIIFRIKSNIIRENLLIEENFDFSKAISICRLREQSSKQFNEI